MKDQPIPEAIKNLFVEEDEEAAASANKKNHFVSDFDTRAVAVIYRSHGDNNKKMNMLR